MPSTIIVDCHEPEHIVTQLKALFQQVDVVPLEVGDYQIDNKIIERKTVTDLISSISDGRLWDQLLRLMKVRENDYKPLVAIIGEMPTFDYVKKRPMTKDRFNYFRSVIQGVQITIATSYNIPFLEFKDEQSFLAFLVKLSKKSKSTRPVVTVKKENRTIEEVKSDMLSQIDGIGRIIADHLAKAYTIADLCSLSKSKLSNLEINDKKIGLTKAKNIYDALHK